MVPPCPSALRHAGRRPTIKVEFMLGRGGQATVYAARRVRRSGFVQRVALKVAERHAQSEALLKREARLQAQLQHRHIVAAHDLLTLGGHLALLMEHVDGADLRRIACRAARQHNPSVRAVLEAGRDIAAALDHLSAAPLPGHPRGATIVHRDIKPANILVDPSRGARLTDFGVAVVLGDTVPTAVRFAGTPGYIAPEVAHRGECSPASDIYALGASLLELLRLRRLKADPNTGESVTNAALRAALATLPFRQAPAVLARVGSLLATMLDPDPTQRPTAAEVQVVLGELAPLAPGATLTDWARAGGVPHTQPDLLNWPGRIFRLNHPTSSAPTRPSDLNHLLTDLPPVPPVAVATPGRH